MKQARQLVHYREYQHGLEPSRVTAFPPGFKSCNLFIILFAIGGGGGVPALDRVEITPIESKKITKSRPDICSIAEKAREMAYKWVNPVQEKWR